MARVVQFNLQKSGYEVTVAPNGLVAWQQAVERQYDAIITDFQMPEMDGLELCRRLRELPNYADTPMVLLTAKGLELELPQLKNELNFSATFSKPFSPAKVVQAIDELLTV